MSDEYSAENFSKFNTCVYRSIGEEIHYVAACCGERSIIEGFVCTKLKLFGLKPETCESCKFYSESLNILL
jgi:hypothetical protein